MIKPPDYRLGDCLSIMPELIEQSIDMVLCDLPYGTTACKWDAVIPFAALWAQYERLVKPKGALVFTAAQPFTAALVMSKPDWFRHEWIWDKVRPSGMQIAKYRPMQRHESVLVFSKQTPNYYPQMTLREEAVVGRAAVKSGSSPLAHLDKEARSYTHKYPQSIMPCEATAYGIIDVCKPNDAVHPTQKPVALMSFLLQTYSREGDTVLDNTMGSGSTGVACVIENRNFIGIELDRGYFAVAEERIQKEREQPVGRHYFFGVDADGSTAATLVNVENEKKQPNLFG